MNLCRGYREEKSCGGEMKENSVEPRGVTQCTSIICLNEATLSDNSISEYPKGTSGFSHIASHTAGCYADIK